MIHVAEGAVSEGDEYIVRRIARHQYGWLDGEAYADRGMTMDTFFNIPKFIWDNIFVLINTLVCGIIVAYFTSTFLKKKEERNRIIGVIGEKRINAQQEIVHYIESRRFKKELLTGTDTISHKNDGMIGKLLEEYDLPQPFDDSPQYSEFFESMDYFEEFYHGLEEVIARNKLWLDRKVRNYLFFMQGYYNFFNVIPLMIKRIPLPKDKELTREEFDKICDKVLQILGISFDNEMNELSSELDNLVVDSIYRLDLRRPKYSIQKNNMYNPDMKKIMKRLSMHTELLHKELEIYQMMIDFVYTEKDFDPDDLTDEEYEEFYKENDPEGFEADKQDLAVFEERIKEMCKEHGVQLVHKKEMEGHPEDYEGMYAISLKDALEGREPKTK